MTLAVEEDVTFDPFDVGLLSANAVMLRADYFPNLLKQFGHGRRILLPNPGLCRTSAV